MLLWKSVMWGLSGELIFEQRPDDSEGGSNENSLGVRMGVIPGRGNKKCRGLSENFFGLFKANQELQRSEQGRTN